MLINLDVNNRPIQPIFTLSRRNGNKYGSIRLSSLKQSGSLREAGEISCVVYKEIDGVREQFWNDIIDLKLIHDEDHDIWYEINVDIDDSTSTSKTISGQTLCESELSQIMLYDIEINTEEDISRFDYDQNYPTIFYRAEPDDESLVSKIHGSSLLHRLFNKAPHYKIGNVDPRIASIQRMFSFNKKSILDAIREIEEECGCLFIFNNGSDEEGKPARSFDVVDLQTVCKTCGYRGDYSDKCPECGSYDLQCGYGEDTTIFITSDELSDKISFTTDVDSVKNCFKLESGDEIMDAAIRACNPNGSSYLWDFSDSTKADMSAELRSALDSYEKKYDDYRTNKEINVFTADEVSQYNSLVEKYKEKYASNHTDTQGKVTAELYPISSTVVGYSNLMQTMYDVIDLYHYLNDSMCPSVSVNPDDLKASTQASNLYNELNNSTVAVQNLSNASESTVKSAVLSYAKCIVNPNFSIKIKSSNWNQSTKKWVGTIYVENYSDKEDNTDTEQITVSINGDYKTFVEQKISKTMSQDEVNDNTISGLFSKYIEHANIESNYDIDSVLNPDDVAYVKNALTYYNLSSLSSFHESSDKCYEVLSELSLSYSSYVDIVRVYSSIFDSFIELIEYEMNIRDAEVKIISTSDVLTNIEISDSGVFITLSNVRSRIQNELDFESCMENYWDEFCSYRRETTYSNDNYISDGLTNSQLFEYALDFITAASNEIYKSAVLQHSISSTLKNLLVIPKFAPLRQYFNVGNFLRVRVDDEVYKLRLLEYTIDYEDLQDIDVVFSDITHTKNGTSDLQNILDSVSTMATSYDSVTRQALAGKSSYSMVDNWIKKGLDTTLVNIVSNSTRQDQVFNDRGLWCRRWEDTNDGYDPEQLKISNSTIAITDDYWKTMKAAIGKFNYTDPITGEMKTAYGVNGEVLLGNIVLGETLKLHNGDSSLLFDQNGLNITNGDIIIKESPNSSIPISISKLQTDGTSSTIFSVDSSGSAIFAGTINATGGTFSGNITSDAIISGGTFLGNTIRSVNYSYSNGNFSSNGMEIALGGNGYIRAKNFAIDTNGNAYLKGDIKSTATISGGTIYGAKITGDTLSIETTTVEPTTKDRYTGGIWSSGKQESNNTLYCYNDVTIGVYLNKGTANEEFLCGMKMTDEGGGVIGFTGLCAFAGDQHFYGSTEMTSLTVRSMKNIDCGKVSGVSVLPESYEDYSVSFHHTFQAVPTVTVTRYASSTPITDPINSTQRSIVVYSVTTSGFKVRIYNNPTNSWSCSFYWQAIYFE